MLLSERRYEKMLAAAQQQILAAAGRVKIKPSSFADVLFKPVLTASTPSTVS